MSQKPELREQFRKRRDTLSFEERASKSLQICRHLEEFVASPGLGFLAGELWLSYRAKENTPQTCEEVDLLQLTRSLSAKIRWAFPRVCGGKLEFRQVNAHQLMVEHSTGFSRGAFGLWEPKPELPLVNLADVKGVLLPGLAFDEFGTRLGWGKAFYDNTLANFTGVKIGVAFALQVSGEKLPAEAHDVCVDYLATENGVSKVKKKE